MTGEEKKVVLTPQELANLLKGTVEQTIKAAQGKASEYKLASEPFKRKTEGEQEAEKYGKIITRPKSKVDAKKELVGFKTGTFIDQLFLGEDNKPLGGIPVVCQLGLTGLAGCGKSILVQEMALRCASEGRKVIFVSSEDMFESLSPRFDLQSRLKQKSDILKLDWETIRNNLFVLDAVAFGELRDWNTFIETFRYLVEVLQGIDLLIIDSVTLMQAYRGSLKYRVIELSRYCQVHGVTTIYVCQRAEDKADELNVAGGIGLSHNLDIMMCIDKKKASGKLKEDFGVKLWTECHFARVMACRMCSFDGDYKKMTISSDGFLKLVKPDQKA